MIIYYQLKIEIEESKYDKLSEIFNLTPRDKSIFWTYEIIDDSDDSDEYIDYFEHFVNIIDENKLKIEALNIDISDFYILMLIEEEENDQMNFEILPKDLKLLGDRGITLCWSIM